MAQDQFGTVVFYVDNGGNVYLHGTVHTFARPRGGGQLATYGTQATSPLLEDVGRFELRGGSARVALRASFHEALEGRVDYEIFLTPYGDSRGLYVAERSANGFTVRENSGGSSTLPVDYRVVAVRSDVPPASAVPRAVRIPATPPSTLFADAHSRPR